MTAQLVPAPSEKTITDAASSRYSLEVDRTSEQSAGLHSIRTYIRTVRVKETFPKRSVVKRYLPCGLVAVFDSRAVRF